MLRRAHLAKCQTVYTMWYTWPCVWRRPTWMQAFTNVPGHFPAEHQNLDNTSQFDPCKAKLWISAPQRGGCTGLTSRWGYACCCRVQRRDSPSDWQSADSRRTNAGSVEAEKIRSLLLPNKDTHFISSLLLKKTRLENRIYSLCYFHWSQEVSKLQCVTSLT